MGTEYQREVAAFNEALPSPNTADSTVDILLDKLSPRLPSSGTISVLAAADIPAVTPSAASATTTGVIVQDGTTGTPDVVTMSSSATANTFGSWVQVDASTSAISWISHITIRHQFDTALIACIEIGTGAAGSEVTKIRLSFASTAAGNYFSALIFSLPIPIKVAAGVRIAVRASDSKSSEFVYAAGVSFYQSLET